MEKKYVTRKKRIYLEYESFDSVIRQMDDFKKKHPTGTDFKFDGDYVFEVAARVYLICTELETDGELAKRCKVLEEVNEKSAEKERKEYERLKKKFEGKKKSK